MGWLNMGYLLRRDLSQMMNLGFWSGLESTGNWWISLVGKFQCPYTSFHVFRSIIWGAHGAMTSVCTV